MPSVVCQYCNATIQNARNLSRHQLTKTCLSMQRRLGLKSETIMFTCDCGFASAIRDELKIHQRKCEQIGDVKSAETQSSMTDRETAASVIVTATMPTNINNTQNIVNNTQNITNNTQNNFFFFGCDDIAKNYILRTMSLPSQLRLDLSEKGYAALSGQVIITSITNDEGCSDIRVADASRKKLVCKTMLGDIEEDRGGHKSGARIGEAVDQVLSMSHKESANCSKVMKTIKDSNKDRDEGRPILRGMILDTCPRSFEEVIRSAHMSDTAKELCRIEEEYNKKNAKERLERGKKWKEHLRFNKIIDPDTERFWDDTTCFVWIESDKEISLLGKSLKYQGALIRFSRRDLKNIDWMGLSANVALNSRDSGAEGIDPLCIPVKVVQSKATIWILKFMRYSVPVQGGLMRNNIMKLAVNVESISEEKFTIMGSLNDWSDSPNILTDDQMNRLEAAGVADHIDPKAKPKIYTHDRSQITTDTVCHTAGMFSSQNNSISDQSKVLPNPPIKPIIPASKPDSDDESDSEFSGPISWSSDSDSDEKEINPSTEFLSNSKLLPNGSWMCKLSKFNKLIFKPVTMSGTACPEVTTQKQLASYRRFDFLGSALDGPDHMKSITDDDRKIIYDLGFDHIPTKIPKSKAKI